MNSDGTIKWAIPNNRNLFNPQLYRLNQETSKNS